MDSQIAHRLEWWPLIWKNNYLIAAAHKGSEMRQANNPCRLASPPGQSASPPWERARNPAPPPLPPSPKIIRVCHTVIPNCTTGAMHFSHCYCYCSLRSLGFPTYLFPFHCFDLVLGFPFFKVKIS